MSTHASCHVLLLFSLVSQIKKMSAMTGHMQTLLQLVHVALSDTAAIFTAGDGTYACACVLTSACLCLCQSAGGVCNAIVHGHESSEVYKYVGPQLRLPQRVHGHVSACVLQPLETRATVSCTS